MLTVADAAKLCLLPRWAVRLLCAKNKASKNKNGEWILSERDGWFTELTKTMRRGME